MNFTKLLLSIYTLLFTQSILCNPINNTSNVLDKRDNSCKGFYKVYCAGMEQVYKTVCVPYCRSNSGRGKKYANQNACIKDFCNDHWECHKDCYA